MPLLGPLGGRRAAILVIDDDRPLLEMLQRSLSVDADWEVVSAHGSAAGLELIGARYFDVVLSDYKMPGMTGDILLRAAGVAQPWARRIMMTGSFLPLKMSNAHVMIAKPFATDLILNVLGRAVDSTCEQFATFALFR